MRLSKSEHEARALKAGETAVWSILRDWIKGQLTAVEVGMLSFDGAFLGSLLLNDGRTVLQAIKSSGIIAIEDHGSDKDSMQTRSPTY